mmetsp:Transcript_4937/g.7140  ORF Transcript_4937/g.7140 Transcript_4937/m.7140 type:complete len:143 (+) Transcript_4937:112-540(+)
MVRSAKQKTLSFYVAFAAWMLFAALLIVWDLGVIAFTLSILLAIWFFGLREKWTTEKTASAYSIFNENGQAIVGGFTAQQFENQMRGGLSAGQNDSSLDSIAAPKNQNSKSERAPATDQERLKRRKAAAVAAERRLLFQDKH